MKITKYQTRSQCEYETYLLIIFGWVGLFVGFYLKFVV